MHWIKVNNYNTVLKVPIDILPCIQYLYKSDRKVWDDI